MDSTVSQSGWSGAWDTDWVCKQNEFFIKGADDAGNQYRIQETTSTSHDSSRGEVARQSRRSGPASLYQPTRARLPDSESKTADQEDRRQSSDSCGRSAEVCAWRSS